MRASNALRTELSSAGRDYFLLLSESREMMELFLTLRFKFSFFDRLFFFKEIVVGTGMGGFL